MCEGAIIDDIPYAALNDPVLRHTPNMPYVLLAPGTLYGCDNLGWWYDATSWDAACRNYPEQVVDDCVYEMNGGISGDYFAFPEAWNMAKNSIAPWLLSHVALGAMNVIPEIMAIISGSAAAAAGRKKKRKML